MCEHRSKAKNGGWNCQLHYSLVTQVTCDACELGPGTRKHIRKHPRSKPGRQPPRQPGASAWLRSLGVQPRTHDG